MNILFVSAILPYPLYSGGQIRIYNLLKSLSQKHSITLFSFIRNEEERKFASKLSFLSDVVMVYRGKRLSPKYLVRFMLGKQSLLLSSYTNHAMKNAISGVLSEKRFDLIHIEPFYVYPSLPPLTIPLVVGEHNAEYEVYASYAQKARIPLIRNILSLEASRIKSEEKSVLTKAGSITAVSNDDAKKLQALAGVHNVTVVQNGVDTEFFPFYEKKFDGKIKSFLFVGNFLWLPNREVTSHILLSLWPAIRHVLPDATLTIVGKNIPAHIVTDKTRGVIVDRNVPDIRSAYRTCDVLLAPMGIGGGTKFKILEAMVSGCAILTTSEGIAGITDTPKTYAGIADSVESFTHLAADIYGNPEKWKMQCRRASEYIRGTYNWKTISDTLESVWKKTLR